MHVKQVLQNTIYDVDLDRILQSIHVYLQELGMDEIRKRYRKSNSLNRRANISCSVFSSTIIVA